MRDERKWENVMKADSEEDWDIVNSNYLHEATVGEIEQQEERREDEKHITVMIEFIVWSNSRPEVLQKLKVFEKGKTRLLDLYRRLHLPAGGVSLAESEESQIFTFSTMLETAQEISNSKQMHTRRIEGGIISETWTKLFSLFFFSKIKRIFRSFPPQLRKNARKFSTRKNFCFGAKSNQTNSINCLKQAWNCGINKSTKLKVLNHSRVRVLVKNWERARELFQLFHASKLSLESFFFSPKRKEGTFHWQKSSSHLDSLGVCTHSSNRDSN